MKIFVLQRQIGGGNEDSCLGSSKSDDDASSSLMESGVPEEEDYTCTRMKTIAIRNNTLLCAM